MMLTYLFSFDFRTLAGHECVDDKIIEFLKKTKTNYYYDFGFTIFADLYKTGKYYRITTRNIDGNVEVYAETGNDTHANTGRGYENTYFIKVNLENGDYITTRIHGNSETITAYYGNVLTMHYNGRETAEKVKNIEFLEFIRG